MKSVLPNQGPNGEGHAIVILNPNSSNGTYTVFNPTLGINQTYTGGDLAGTNFLLALD